MRLKLSRTHLEAKLANLPPCLVGMEACVGAHHLGPRLKALGHDPRLMPAKYVKAFLKGNKKRAASWPQLRDQESVRTHVRVRRPRYRQRARCCQADPFGWP